MKSKAVLAYWAGVFDAAGCICMKVTPTLPAPYMAFRSTSRVLPDELKRAWGGGVRHERGGTYVWSTSHTRAVDIVYALQPYMSTKVEPRVFEWVPGTRGRKRSPSARVVRLMSA